MLHIYIHIPLRYLPLKLLNIACAFKSYEPQIVHAGRIICAYWCNFPKSLAIYAELNISFNSNYLMFYVTSRSCPVF